MYKYDQYDHQILQERVAQFRGQTDRFLNGELKEEEFLPLRLQNGLYIQRLAPMLRINVPYGMINSEQLRRIADIARKYDKGYCHVTTRQNIQFNWPKLEDVPDILAELAEVEMHATQSSGNCIRNTTSDQFAGISVDEVIDPRPYCELIRQWSSFHPEFAFLPRKFKIAVTGSDTDRAAIQVHDIGLQVLKNENNEVGFRVLVGGGLGRTPAIGSLIKDFLPEKHLLTYLDAILRTYNLLGRRDNKYKARIKILVKAMGIDAFKEKVEIEWAHSKGSLATLTNEELNRVSAFFSAPNYEEVNDTDVQTEVDSFAVDNIAFSKWLNRNTFKHKISGYSAVVLSLKPTGVAPGDITDRQLNIIADIADEYSFGEVRTTHDQNIVLADVKKSNLFTLWKLVKKAGFATPNIGTLTDIICCPGGDFCSLANAKSIPVAESIQRRFDDIDYVYDIGDLDINISGCMNACGHHHVGHIGILGVDKKGVEYYQVQLGGRSNEDAALGRVLGPAFAQEDVTNVIDKIINVYISNRYEDEIFVDTYNRIGLKPFKESIYGN
jgi:sulfite reductase (NADPH) hemoprotein beta-component